MNYCEEVKSVLETINDNKISFRDQYEVLLNDVKRKMEERADYYIVCGYSPLGRVCLDYLGERYSCEEVYLILKSRHFIPRIMLGQVLP